MAWTAPTTSWADGNVLGASDMNVIGNDLNYLLSGISASGKYDKGADITSTSTTFADIDATNLAKTVTLVGTKAIIVFRGAALTNSTTIGIGFDIAVNGTRWHSTGANGSWACFTGSSTNQGNASATIVVDGLTPGSNTFKIQWIILSAGTMTLRAGAGSAPTDFIPALDVWGA